jgi:hypothetical protein
VRFRAIGVGVFGLAAAITLASAGVDCSSGDDNSGDDGGGYVFDSYVEGPYFCDDFTEVGAPCPYASPTICFPLCTDGGCYCRQTANGPVWQCDTDLSCLPESGPLDDSGDFDAGVDSGVDGGVDSGVDSGTDSGIDAAADAGIDSGVDAAADASGDAEAGGDDGSASDATTD